MQATAKSRRKFKMRGRRPAIQGRPRHDQQLAVQLTDGDTEEEDSEIVRHKLPTMKKKKGASHCLVRATEANKRAVKKH